MLAKVLSAAVIGLDAVPIEVEIDIASQGLPSFTIVGLPDKAVEEAKERVRSAIRNSGATFPAKRITVNLAPADIPKEGPSYDLPIALGILLASEQVRVDLVDSLFSGELSLDGRLRQVNGILSHVLLAKQLGLKQIFIPEENAEEGTLVQGIDVYAVPTLLSLMSHLMQQKLLTPVTKMEFAATEVAFEYDMRDIKGQQQAKRALEIAAAGGHNVLLKGPPGAGKTLLARTLPSILPQLTPDEAIEVTKIYSIAGQLGKVSMIRNRPFRAPHHTTSLVGLIGGSSNPKPGEVTLSHRGVLFLDEFPEFPRQVLESLRQPIEDGIVSIARANSKAIFPARCMLVAAQNPCPCGYFGDPTRQCQCAPAHVARYRKKVSGPLLDRIDIHIDVPAIPAEKLTKEHDVDVESSTTIRKRVQRARDKQRERFTDVVATSNAEMNSKMLKEFCKLSSECTSLLERAITTLYLSGRAFHRTIKVARTIADLSESETILPTHLAEALQYRPKATSYLQ